MIDEKRLREIEARSNMTLEQVLALFGSDDFNTPKWFCDLLPEFGTDPCSNPRSAIRAKIRFVFEHELRARECAEWSTIAHNAIGEDVGVRLANLAAAIRAADCGMSNDGLREHWFGSVWSNFPYSDPLPWCQRLHDHDDTWVALAKLDTTTKWWSVLMDSRAEWAPFRHRFKFEQPGKSMTANFPSVLVWKRWEPTAEIAKHLWWKSYGVAA